MACWRRRATSSSLRFAMEISSRSTPKPASTCGTCRRVAAWPRRRSVTRSTTASTLRSPRGIPSTRLRCLNEALHDRGKEEWCSVFVLEHSPRSGVYPSNPRMEADGMRSFLIKISLPVTALVVLYALNAWYSVSPQAAPVVTGTNPAPQSIGPLTFGPDGTLFAADDQAGLRFALGLRRLIDGEVGGLQDIPSIDQKIASTLGTSAEEISITDLAVHPHSHNAFLSIRRGRGADAKPALIRIDGNGAIGLVPFDGMNYSSVGLPDAPTGFRAAAARAELVTDMALVDDRLWVAGLSNEEFSSKLRSVPYPFNVVDHGASVEIFHGSHGQFETNSPVYAFVPFRIGGEPYLIASYLCTPLVTFPMASLQQGGKVRGVTIAELGNGN